MSSSPEALRGRLRGTRPAGDAGFTLVEVMICTLILTIGMVAIAGLLAVTTSMQIGALASASLNQRESEFLSSTVP